MPRSKTSPPPHDWFHDLMDHYRSRITLLPDKPEETLEATVRALCLCATGSPTSVNRAATLPMPSLNTDGWLKDSPANVIVFYYYDILAGEGASALSVYATGNGSDSHPSQAGNTKAAEAFVPFLNRAVRRAGLSQ